MLTLKESMLIGISTCYTKQGLLYDRWLAHFGKNTKDIFGGSGAECGAQSDVTGGGDRAGSA
jgi:hypothetical protein